MPFLPKYQPYGGTMPSESCTACQFARKTYLCGIEPYSCRVDNTWHWICNMWLIYWFINILENEPPPLIQMVMPILRTFCKDLYNWLTVILLTNSKVVCWYFFLPIKGFIASIDKRGNLYNSLEADDKLKSQENKVQVFFSKRTPRVIIMCKIQ